MVRAAALSLAAALLASCGTPSPAARRDAPAAEGPAAPRSPRPEVLVARARALRAQGDLAGARERLEAAHAIAPDSDEVRIELADLLVTDARDLEVAATLLAGVRVMEGPRLHVVAGRLFELQGDDPAAEECYRRALLDGEGPGVRLSRALVLERLARFDDAIAELERVREARPSDPLARARLAELYEWAGRSAEAERELLWAAEAQPERASGWERLGRFYERVGRRADARAALARAREATPVRERALRPLLPSRR